MTSTTSLSENGFAQGRQIFWWTLRRGRGIFFLNVALQFLLFPFLTFLVLQSVHSNYRENNAIYASDTLSEQLFSNFSEKSQVVHFLSLLVGVMFCFLLCYFLFGYMHQKRSVDLIHAMPVRRIPLLLGKYAAGLVILWVPVVVCAILDLAVGALMGVGADPSFSPFLFGTILPFLFWNLVITGACLSFFLFFAVCCGTLLDTIISVVAINIFYPLLIALLWFNASYQIPGFSLSGIGEGGLYDFLHIVVPLFCAVATPINRGMDLLFQKAWIMLAVGIVFTAASCLLYRRRKSECAESGFAFPIPKYIICFIATAASALAAGVIFQNFRNTFLNYSIGLVIGSVLAHVISEAIYSRGFRNLVKSFRAYGVFAVVFIVAYVSVAFGFFGYDTRIPQASQVESVTVDIPTYYLTNRYDQDTFSFRVQKVEYDKYGGYRYEDTLKNVTHTLYEPETIEKTIAFHQALVNQYREELYPYIYPNERYYRNITLTYHMKDGSEFKRCYSDRIYEEPDDVTEAEKCLVDLFNLREYRVSGNVLYYLEPDALGDIRVTLPEEETPNTSGGVPETQELDEVLLDLTTEEKQELLEALRQDIDEMQAVPDQTWDNTAQTLIINMDCSEPFVPQGEAVKELLGDRYNPEERVAFSSYIYLSLGKNYPRTAELIKAMLLEE